MPILKDLTKKLKKITQAATAKFKEPKSNELESALQKIIVAINNFNLIKVVDEENTKEFTEKIKSIFKSTCLRKYYKPGENDKVTYKRSGLAGIIFRELYIYLTQNFRQGVNTAYAPAAEWLSIKDKIKLKESFKSTYKAKFGSDEAWVESILYNEKVLTKLFNIAQRVQIGQESTPPKGQTPQLPKAEASKTPRSPIKLPSAPPISKVKHDVLINSISDIFLSSRFDPKLTSEETREFNALKKYFKDNALTITNKIMNLKEAKNREEWVKYFIDKPFSTIMTYENFENYLYGKDGGLFQEMLKDGIRPNAPIPENSPKGVKLPAQKQPSKPSTPPPNMPPQPVSQPKSAPQKAAESAATSNAKTTAIANATAAVTSANAAAETAKEAAEKVKQLAFDAKTNDDAKTYANLAQKSAEEAQEFAKKAQRFKTEIDQQEYTTDEDATHFAKKAQQNANEAQKASQKAKKFAKEAQEYAKKQVPPNAPPVSQTRPTSANTHIDANELKNKRNSLHRVKTDTRSQASFENNVEKTFKNATNSDMFKRAQQQNLDLENQDDDDAWTD